MPKFIDLSRGLRAIVDDDDYDDLMQHKWSASASGYAYRMIGPKKKRTSVWMQRQILSAPAGIEVDHANGDKLDNRRSNLRLATRAQNAANTPKSRGTSSQYKGVIFHKRANRWMAYASGQYIGLFDTEQEAARAYDHRAQQLYGSFARLNFAQGDSNA